MAFSLVNGIDICHRVEGRGEPLLYIGGTNDDLRLSPGIFDSPLAERFRILAYDQRGMGRSGKPAGPYTMADYAADAAGLLETLEMGPCRVLGFSFGGMVAQELAISRPDLVTRLALAGTSSGGEGGASHPLHELAALPLEEKVDRLMELADRRKNAQWREEFLDQYRSRRRQMLDKFTFAAGEKGHAAGAAAQLEARAGHDTWERLPGLNLPVLVAGGVYDNICPPANCEALAERIPGAELALFEGGHYFLLEDPDAFRAIINFMER